MNKTIKIPEKEYDLVLKARKLLVKKGLNRLKPSTRKIIETQIKDFDKLTIGIIIAIGSSLLISELECKK